MLRRTSGLPVALLAAVVLATSPRGGDAGCAFCEAPGPASQAAQPAWLAKLKAERDTVHTTINYTGGVFDTPALQWTQSAFIQPQMHPYDRYFYDPKKGYTVDRYLDDLKTRYGGVDAILMWPTYTNIGSDDRNQFDYFRAMPGGLEGVKNATAQLKKRGIRVLWPYNPWDKGTRREPVSDEATFAKLLKQTGGDGFNGDTMGFVPESFWTAALDASYPLAFEPEGGGTDAALDWSTMGWGYWTFPTAPNVDRFKFLTEGKFMTNICARWETNKTDNLQSAWFNGAGYESWENVWGTWNGITPRDGEAIRRVATMLRFFGRPGDLDLLHSPDWEPHVPRTLQDDVYASRFPGPGGKLDLYTIVNRGGRNLTKASSGQQLWFPRDELSPKARAWDCYHGTELDLETPTPVAPTPAPAVPTGYHVFPGANAFSGHGATDIDDKPVSGLSVDACAARCDADTKCACITFLKQGGQCWKRAACAPSGFDDGTEYDVYVRAKPGSYSLYPGLNAYNGHGGAEIDTDATAPSGLTPEKCQARCDADSKCSCVTFLASSGKCWKRGNCVPSQFDVKDSQYSVFVAEAKQPECAPAFCPSAPAAPSAGAKAVSFDIEAGGFGCVLVSPSGAAPTSATSSFLETMKGLTAGKPLAGLSDTWKYLPQTMVSIPKTPTTTVGATATRPPEGMVHVPKNASWLFVSTGVEIEGDDAHGVDVQFPWEDSPRREHSKVLSVGPFYVDRFPVTTTNYSDFLRATGYAGGKEPHNFLKNWGISEEEWAKYEYSSYNNATLRPPPALADVPVTYISLDEARAFCAHHGKRLPHTYEWQYAAQGSDGRQYPWGNTKDQARFPKMSDTNVFPGPVPVNAHPSGASPFGVQDLVGNVYQYTDEFQDDHTRAVVLRGGSNYRPTGSLWYLPQALELDVHEKYFLMSDTYERAGTIGFRCVQDAAE